MGSNGGQVRGGPELQNWVREKANARVGGEGSPLPNLPVPSRRAARWRAMLQARVAAGGGAHAAAAPIAACRPQQRAYACQTACLSCGAA